VEYSASGFLAKNNESLTNDLAALALTTTSPFLAAIYESGRNRSGVGGSGGTGKSSSDIEPPPLQHSAGGGGGGGRGGASSSSSSSGGASTKLLGSDTVSLTFRGQMGKLQEILETTSSHFLRCVKPNARQLAAGPAAAGAGALGVNSNSNSSSSSIQGVFGSFDGPMVLEQLNYLGVLETIRIRQVRHGIRIGNMVR
jgi:myosin heavy subunit